MLAPTLLQSLMLSTVRERQANKLRQLWSDQKSPAPGRSSQKTRKFSGVVSLLLLFTLTHTHTWKPIQTIYKAQNLEARSTNFHKPMSDKADIILPTTQSRNNSGVKTSVDGCAAHCANQTFRTAAFSNITPHHTIAMETEASERASVCLWAGVFFLLRQKYLRWLGHMTAEVDCDGVTLLVPIRFRRFLKNWKILHQVFDLAADPGPSIKFHLVQTPIHTSTSWNTTSRMTFLFQNYLKKNLFGNHICVKPLPPSWMCSLWVNIQSHLSNN